MIRNEERRYVLTTYERPGPLSDMFVPRRETVTLSKDAPYRSGMITVALLIILATPVLAHESSTRAYFSDIEGSVGNTLAAGPLDISVAVDPTEATLIPDAPEIFTFTVTPEAGSLPLVYEVSYLKSGDLTFCNAISVNGVPVGASTDFDGWQANLTYLVGGATAGAMCQVDFTFDAYQEGGVAGTEYHDIEMVSLTLTAGGEIAPLLFETSSLRAFSVESIVEEPPAEPLVLGEATSTPDASPEPQSEPLQDVPPADSPVDEQKVEEPTVEEPALEEPPTETPPVEEPTEEPPAEEIPAEESAE